MVHAVQRARTSHLLSVLDSRLGRQRSITVAPWSTASFGPLYLRCDICRRFALVQLGAHQLRDVDYRTKRFSCSVCGDEAWLTVTDPCTERGMGDYRLDQREQPERHPRTVERLTGNRRKSSVDLTAGELPGRKVDGRR